MSLIQDFMPRCRLRQVDHLAVMTAPAETWRRVRALDLYELAIARRLFALRLVPDRVVARLRGMPPPLAPTASIEQIVAAGSGFHLLAENDREVVVGSIGRFWRPSIEWADVSPATFAAFDIDGWGRLAWNVAVAPRPGGAWITIDLRVDAGDDASWRRFQRYWHVIGPFSHAIRHGMLRRFAHDLGAAPPDEVRPLAGDDRIPEARTTLTHAIDIEAPPAQVWPWLVQMGGKRAGWYSWDRLDNDGVPSADHIIPELQHLAVGDIIPATPRSDDGFRVLALEPPRLLVLGSETPLWNGTWTFALEPIGDDATHLVTRYRADHEPALHMKVVTSVAAPVHAFMEKKQLLTIKQRSESAATPARAGQAS